MFAVMQLRGWCHTASKTVLKIRLTTAFSAVTYNGFIEGRYPPRFVEVGGNYTTFIT